MLASNFQYTIHNSELIKHGRTSESGWTLSGRQCHTAASIPMTAVQNMSASFREGTYVTFVNYLTIVPLLGTHFAGGVAAVLVTCLAVGTNAWQKQLEFMDTVHDGKEVIFTRTWGDQSHCIWSQKVESNEGWCSTPSLISIQSKTPWVHSFLGMVWATQCRSSILS